MAERVEALRSALRAEERKIQGRKQREFDALEGHRVWTDDAYDAARYWGLQYGEECRVYEDPSGRTMPGGCRLFCVVPRPGFEGICEPERARREAAKKHREERHKTIERVRRFLNRKVAV